MSYNHEYPYTDPYRGNADWLINQVKAFGKTLASWEDTINQLVAALRTINEFDARISALEEATADLQALRNRVTNLEKGLADTNARLDEIVINYDLVLEEIARLTKLFPTYLKLANQYTDNKVRNLFIEFYTYIEELEREIEELKKLRPERVYNSVRGREYELQKAYELAYNDMREDALSIAQFAELGLTTSEFAALNLNNLSFSLHSRSIFKWDYVTAPISKLYKPIAHAINEVLEFVLGSFTVDEFAALDLTCEQFAALDYTCIDFLAANDSNRGLTDTEFVDIIKSGGSNILRL